MGQEQSQKLEIRRAAVDEIGVLYDISARMGAHNPPDFFEKSFACQAQGEREVLIAWLGDEAVGYCFLSWTPKYAYYKAEGIPEIQALSVLPAQRRCGFGRAMIEACEDRARAKGCAQMGISVGLHAGFGAAQRLYTKMGYVPDGYGVTYDRSRVLEGEFKPIDDQLCLMMVKRLI